MRVHAGQKREGVIRMACVADAGHVSALYEHLGRRRAVEARELERFLAAADQWLALYVPAGGEPAGLVAWCLWPAGLSFPRPLCFIQDLVVAPDFRRQGIGSRLLGYARERGRGRGVRVFHLQASAGETPGLGEFYRRNGFEAKNQGFYAIEGPTQ